MSVYESLCLQSPISAARAQPHCTRSRPDQGQIASDHCRSDLITGLTHWARAGYPFPEVNLPEFGGEPTQFKEWIFAVNLSLRTGMIKDGQDQVDFASSFLEGTALLWFLSCLESRRTFANWAELKESLSPTFGPLDEEEDDRLNLFALTQTGPLDDYIQDFSRLSLNLTALDEHSRALLFERGLTDGLRADAMREHPRTLSEAIRAARTARRNAVLTRPRGSVGSSRN